MFFKKKFFLCLFFFQGILMFSQEQEKSIEVKHADDLILDEKYPDLKLLSGNVILRHKDAVLTSEKALLDIKNNFAEAIGGVELKQGDSLNVKAEIIRYDGNREIGVALGKVYMTDPKMSLRTDTLYYDLRNKIAYYDSGGIIQDSANTLKSRTGKYLANQRQYQFTGNVLLTNPDYTIESAHLNYNTENGQATFFGPTEIRGNNGFIYAEKGFYDTQNDQAWFTRHVFMRSGSSEMHADSVYMDKATEFYSATGNVRMKDTVNKVMAYAGYVEQWKKQDSVYLTQNPVIIHYEQNQDSLFLAADRIFIRGPKEKREFFAFPRVRFFQKGFSGRADSLYRSEILNIIELHKNPVVWTEDSQITGREIIIQYDSTGRKPDSLIIPENVFIIQKDSAGYNQIKGNKLEGKFIEGKLRKIKISGNTEIVYYVRDEDDNLVGIDKSVCSYIEISLDENGQIETVKLIEEPEGTTYPPDKVPEQITRLDGFVWMGDRRIRSASDLIQYKKDDFNKPEMKSVKETDQNEKFKIPKKFFKGL